MFFTICMCTCKRCTLLQDNVINTAIIHLDINSLYIFNFYNKKNPHYHSVDFLYISNNNFYTREGKVKNYLIKDYLINRSSLYLGSVHI